MKSLASCLVTLIAAALLPSQALAAMDEWKFRVYLDDKDIGYHSFRLRDETGAKQVESEARFKVKFLFINAYQYSHDSSERWNRGCLTHIDSKTQDNGTKLAVRGKAEGDRFLVQGPNGTAALSGCLMTFAYWNPSILTQTHLLNAQTGKYQEVRVHALGEETIPVKGANLPAKRYALVAEDYRIDLWYAEDRRWLALETVTENGRVLRYRIQ